MTLSITNVWLYVLLIIKKKKKRKLQTHKTWVTP